MTRHFSITRRSGLIWLMAVFLLAFIGWAALFDIDQSVRAQGSVVPSARTQVVQAVEGGVLRKLMVQEGDKVEAQQILALLEEDRSKAAVGEVRSKLAAQEAALARLTAESESTPLTFPDGLEKHWPEIVMAQKNLYQQRRNALDGELGSIKRAMLLAHEELEIHRNLQVDGDVAKVEVNRVERQVIDLESRRRAALDKYHSEASAEFAKLQEERASMNYRMDDRQYLHRQLELRSPLPGIVKYIRVTTEGGVLRAGEELLQVSPVDDEALIELKINPADVGQLYNGLKATIQLDAFDSTIFGRLTGVLVYVSPDTLVEQNGAQGQPNVYYRAHVKIDWEGTSNNTRILPKDIKPGMTATVDIRTGERSILKYLYKPINKALSGALSEK